MDPDGKYDEMTEVAHRKNWPATERAARALLGWLEAGGYPPEDLTRAEARETAARLFGRSRRHQADHRRARQRRAPG